MTKFNIQNLSFAYGDFPVLKNVAFEVKTNTVNVILGLNGSGKTTLIKLMFSLKEPKNPLPLLQTTSLLKQKMQMN